MNCKVMGIVNVTPDSFSDGGRFFKPEEAIRRVRNLVAEGADVIDLGAESTRPDATPLSWEEEWARLEPVLEGLGTGRERRGAGSEAQNNQIILSIDTYHPETAERALRAGARMINCVHTTSVQEMVKICKNFGAGLVIPAVFLGPVPNLPSLYIDPMIGFGTSREEDIALLRSVPDLAKKGRVLVGVSRKRIVRRLSGEHGVGKLLGGSVALALWCAAQGASMVRVHDVRETVEALAAWSALGCADCSLR